MSGLEAVKTRWQDWRQRLQRWLPGPRIAPSALHDPAAATRWRAVRALRHHPSPELLPELMTLGADEDELVRAALVDTLASWGPQLVLPALQKALATDASPLAASTWLMTLSRLPDASARSSILPWLEEDDPDVRGAALMALAALGDDADAPLLIAAWEQGDRHVRQAILTTLRAPAAEPLVARALQSDDALIRQRALQAQARLQAGAKASAQASSNAAG